MLGDKPSMREGPGFPQSNWGVKLEVSVEDHKGLPKDLDVVVKEYSPARLPVNLHR